MSADVITVDKDFIAPYLNGLIWSINGCLELIAREHLRNDILPIDNQGQKLINSV